LYGKFNCVLISIFNFMSSSFVVCSISI
jgi:hypothetical protein